MTFTYFYTDKNGTFDVSPEGAARFIKRGQLINPTAQVCEYDEDGGIPHEYRGLGVLQGEFPTAEPAEPVVYPTTVHVSTTSPMWGLAADPVNAQRVAYRLAELCPDARGWTWFEGECIHPETEQHVTTAIVIVPSGYKALVNRLIANLPVRRYDMTMIQKDQEQQLDTQAAKQRFSELFAA